MNRIAIMGLGLMGGSLGLALKARGYDGTIAAYARRAETRAVAMKAGLVDEVFADPAEAVTDADLVVYCTPILNIPELVERSKSGFKEGALLTDVGSTKAELAGKVSEVLRGSGANFVGSHPVAGSEQQGIEAARADLYDGALVVVTPQHEEREKDAVRRVEEFWTGIGALVSVISVEEHDRLMARTSHLPHLAAALLAATAGRDGTPVMVGRFCGTGFRDTSRVADGSPEIWHDIVSTNAGAIGEELRAYRSELDQLIEWMEQREFEKVKRFLEESRDCRRALMASSPAE